jgi:hypothetical protein
MVIQAAHESEGCMMDSANDFSRRSRSRMNAFYAYSCCVWCSDDDDDDDDDDVDDYMEKRDRCAAWIQPYSHVNRCKLRVSFDPPM